MKKKFALLLLMFFVVGAFADDLPKIAIYVSGDLNENEKRLIGREMLNALVLGRDGGIAAGNSQALAAEIERARGTAAINDSLVHSVGKLLGFRYVCLMDVSVVADTHHISIRIHNVETARVSPAWSASGHLNSMQALEGIISDITASMSRRPASAQATFDGTDFVVARSVLPGIAVYVTGELSDAEKRVLEAEILSALYRSGQFRAVERFSAEVERAEQGGGAMDDNRLSQLGKQFGVDFVCVADVTKAFGFLNEVQARVLSVETASALWDGRAAGQLNSMEAIVSFASSVVENMGFRAQPSPPQAASAGESGVVGRGGSPQPVADPAVPREPPKASVYVTGLPGPIGNTLSRAINNALMRTGIYAGMESIDRFVSGAADDAQLISAGMQAGVNFIFVVNVSGQIAVRIIDVRAAAVMAQISMSGQITAVNAAVIAKRIVDFILKSGPQPDPAARVAQGGGSTAANSSRSRGEGEFTQGFSGDARFGTWFLNTLIPGLGSGAIMRDGVGATVIIGTYTLGWVLVGSGYNTGNDDTLIMGVLSFTFCGIYNIVRSATYRRSIPSAAINDRPQGLNLAVFPDAGGNLKAYALYSMEF